MKRPWQEYAGFIIAVLVLIVCTVVVLRINNPRDTAQTDDSTIVHQIISPLSTETIAEIKVPDTVSMELDDLLTVDAVVRCPETLLAQLPKFRAEIQVFSGQEVFDVLFSGKSVTQKDTHPAEDGTDNYHLVYWSADGSLLVCGSAIIDFHTPFSDRIESVFYPNYSYNYRVGDTYYNADQFPKSKDLEFRSVDEVYSELQLLFSEWGIELSSEYDCYTLDHETLAEQSLIISERNSSTLWSGYQSTYKDYPWSADDECYYFVLRQDVQGIPMTILWHGGTDDGTSVSGSEIKVMYGSGGIERLYCFWTYRFSDDGPTGIADIISLEKALETVAKKFENIILTSEVTVSEIEFCYAPCRNGEQFDIIPVWIFKTEQMDTNIGRMQINYIFVNAETGEEIE